MSATQTPPSSSSLKKVRRSPWAQEWFLAVTLATVLVFVFFGEAILPLVHVPLGLVGLLSGLFFVVMGTAMGVVRHAEAIAERLGEPFGTLVLTLSITGIEVCSITAVMMHGESNPDLVRDTLFSVVMIVLGGMIGTALLVGALRYKEQEYNLQGANAYLGVIVPLAVFTLILPDVTNTTAGPTLSTMQKVMVGAMSAGLFVVFLALQTGRHRAYFSTPEDNGESGEHGTSHDQPSMIRHILLLLVYIVPVVYLVEQLAHPIDYVIETLHAPQALGGVLMAVLVATPEAVGGVKSALSNRLQRSINIFLGSVLATIGLTVPVMLVVASILGLELNLGLPPTQMLLLVTMLATSIITFSSKRTNLMQGAVHLLLFMAFILLLFQS
ncbi:calcium:proton antiporter [Pseudooceanicola algae]|uniref:Sodium-potassium/proton antiporter ChaA n=1 Tax=Pseudooceanicola algae TaxID=1537215 RepID=A0A418SJ28_9RHOB|nr:calcium:proton antiporter [Pseudooceanicola algae]QPM91975.1 Sodium-potassium/proton antiporter ChaA [Pseudooceanicola algae]